MLLSFRILPILATMPGRQEVTFTVVDETLHRDGITDAAGYGTMPAFPTNHHLPDAM